MEAELFDHVHTLGGYIERKIRKGEATVWGVNWSRKQQERDVVMKNIDREMAIYMDVFGTLIFLSSTSTWNL